MKVRNVVFHSALRRAVLAVLATAGPVAGQTPRPAADPGLESLLSTTVSTAAKYSQRVRQVSGSVTVVTAEDIQRFGYRTIGEILQSMAGVYASNDRNYSYFGVRGFGRPTDYNNRILLLVDGHTLNEGVYGSTFMDSELAINLDAVERVEIVRGPASAIYGTGALFAVVNVIHRAPRNMAPARVDIERGSFGRTRAGASFSRSSGLDRGFAISGLIERTNGQDLYFPEFDDPATNDGIATDLDREDRAGVDVSADLGDLRLRSMLSFRKRAYPTGAYETAFNHPDAWVSDRIGFLEVEHQAQPSDAHLLTTRAYYADYFYRGSYPTDVDYVERVTNRAFGGEARFQWDVAPSNRLIVGTELRRDFRAEYGAPGEGSTESVLSRPYTVLSLFVQDELQLARNLTVSGGLRHDESSRSKDATTPRAAIIFDPAEQTTLKLMYGKAFRAPTLSQVNFEANGELRPESLRMLELIWMQRFGRRLMLTTSLYHYKVSDLIDGSSGEAFENLGTVRARGLETTLDFRPTSVTRAYFNYSVQRAIEDGDPAESQITNSPEHLAKLGWASDLGRWMTTAVELRYESGRRTVWNTMTDDFLIGNLNLTARPFGARPSRQLGGLEIGFRVTNLFDTRYWHPGGTQHRQNAIEQNGRGIAVRIGYEF